MKGKTHWDVKHKPYVSETSKQGYLAKAVQSFYSNPKVVKNDDKALNAAINMAKRCYDKAEEGQLDNIVENPKKTVPYCRRWSQTESTQASRCFVRMVCRCTDIFKCTIAT